MFNIPGIQQHIRALSTSVITNHGQIERLHLQLITELQRQKREMRITELEYKIEQLKKQLEELNATKIKLVAGGKLSTNNPGCRK